MQIQVIQDGSVAFTMRLNQKLQVGRQRRHEPSSIQLVKGPLPRLIIARQEEVSVSREHLLLTRLEDDRVEIRNISTVNYVQTDAGHCIDPGRSLTLAPPFLIPLGKSSLAVSPVGEESDEALQTLDQATLPPGRTARPASNPPSTLADIDRADNKQLVHWLRVAMEVVQSAATSPDFLLQAARATVELVGLDRAIVLAWNGHHWTREAAFSPLNLATDASWLPSDTLLNRVLENRRTYYNDRLSNPGGALRGSQSVPDSMVDVQAYVAAPILDADGDVVGAVYGDRRVTVGGFGRGSLTAADAMLVELLASGVAAGLARLEQERSAVEARVRFEEFFTPALARQLEEEPDLLAGRDAEISIMFCDVRGFSRISERLAPAETVAWISDVMEELSRCVIAHDGVLVDYIGDELVAMWGAPVPNENHAELACAAAMDMLASLEAVNQRWQAKLGERTEVGVGVNSGVARVGNTGSRLKFKYGPLGNTVNIASRVQGANKKFRTRVLVTRETAEQLSDEFFRRRLARVQVANIDQPLDIYEIRREADAAWCEITRQYEAALTALEAADFPQASRLLGDLAVRAPQDYPVRLQLARAVNGLVNPDSYQHVWMLTKE